MKYFYSVYFLFIFFNFVVLGNKNNAFTSIIPIILGLVSKGLLPDLPLPNEVGKRKIFQKIYTPKEYPNPLRNPKACNRIGNSSSYVCDPNGILTIKEANRLENQLQIVRESSIKSCGRPTQNIQFAVAILRKLPKNETASSFAEELIKLWGLHHYGCQDGVILLYSLEENFITLKWGKGLEPVLNINFYSSILVLIRKSFEKKTLGSAINESLSLIVSHMIEKTPGSRQKSQLVVLGTIAVLVGFLYISFLVNMIIDQLPSPIDNENRKKEAQNYLRKIQKMIQMDRLDLNFCPLTLRTLDPNSEKTIKTNTGFQYQYKALIQWGKESKIDISKSDPCNESCLKNEHIVSKIPDIPVEIKKIPYKVYLISLKKLYPDILGNIDMNKFSVNSKDIWII